MMPTEQNTDNDLRKGAMEDEALGERPMTSMNGQLGHRDQDPLLKSSDSDFPEPGETPEHMGQFKSPNVKEQDTDYESNPEGATKDQDPGHRQKENQNKKGDDDLAA